MLRRAIWYTLIFLVTLIAGGSYWYVKDSQAVVVLDRIAQPQTDLRHYERFTLENGLDVLVISDPDATMAAVALRVDAGSWNDPQDRPGLAHLLTEVLFLDGNTLSKLNPFDELVRLHGGTLSREVTGDRSLIRFDIQANQLLTALSPLAQALSVPGWSATDVDRSLARLDAFYQADRQDDAVKIIDAIQTTYNQSHPAARFANGNTATLGADGLNGALQSYHQRNIQPDNMALVVVGKESTEDLVATVTQHFQGLSGKAITTAVPSDLYSLNQLPAFLQFQPVSDINRTVTFSFPIPPKTYGQKRGADKLLSAILAQTHTGSLFDRLKKAGWIIDINSGLANTSGTATTFDVKMTLTASGERSILDIGTWLFDIVQMIAQQGVPAWQLAEFQKGQLRDFNYAEMRTPIDTVSSLIGDLGHYSERDTLSGPLMNPSLDGIAIADFVKLLQVNRVLVIWASPSATPQDQSAYYGANFALNPLPTAWLQKWEAAAIDPGFLPATPNAFVPSTLIQNTTLRPVSGLYDFLPDVRIQTKGMTYRYLNNDGFNSPRSQIQVALQSPWFYQSTAQRAATELYLALVSDAIKPLSTAANAAGLNSRLWLDPRGVQIAVYGFQDSLGIFTELVASELVALDPQSAAIESARQSLLRQYRRVLNTPVSDRLQQALTALVTVNAATANDMTSAMSRVTVADLLAVQQQIQSNIHLEILTTGNLLPAESDALARRLEGHFMPIAGQSGTVDIATLDRKTAHLALTSQSDDSGLLLYFQGESSSYRERALYDVLSRVSAGVFATTMRDERQLGAQGATTATHFEQIPGITFSIQSHSTDPGLLLLHVDKFLKDQLQTLIQMDPDTFLAYRNGLIGSLTQPDYNLDQQATRWARDLRYQVPYYNLDKRIALEIEKISQTGFIRFYQNQILNADARRIVIYHAGLTHQERTATNYRVDAGDRILSTPTQYQSKRPFQSF